MGSLDECVSLPSLRAPEPPARPHLWLERSTSERSRPRDSLPLALPAVLLTPVVLLRRPYRLRRYFESRPHNRPSGGGGGAAPSSGTTITPASSTHTNFSVPNTAIASVGNAARNQLMGQIRGTNGSGHQDAPGARPQATSPTGGSASSSAPAWQTAGKGLMSKGLGKAGTMASGWQSTPSDGKGPPTAPPAGRRGGGASGLTSSKTFGHVSTDSKLAFAKTLFNDPQKQRTSAPARLPTARRPAITG